MSWVVSVLNWLKGASQCAQLSADLEKSREETRKKTAFLSSLSYDLRTPLNGIALQVQAARISAQANDAAALADAIEQIDANARAAAELLESMLECASLDWQQTPSRQETFAACEAARKAIRKVRTAAALKGLYLQEPGGDAILVRTDRQRFERILDNLISNAVKFTQKGGVRIVLEQYGSDLELQVIDSGIGLSAEEQGRLFDESYQAGIQERDRTRGFGLGLAIARRMARQLGGDITVDSAVECGSRFTLLIRDIVLGRPASAMAPPAPVVAAR